MGTIKRSKSSSERQNWEKIFSALVRMLETQQKQLETLVKERKLLEDRIRMQHNRWISDTRLYEDFICQDVTSRSSLHSGKSNERKRNSKTLNIEVQRLQNANEKLQSERSSEVTALLAEKTFVWNQYNIMENDYKSKLRHERTEVELACTKIENLLANMERLQSLNDEKDCTIGALESKLEKMGIDSRKLNDEISRISHELEVLRKHNGASVTPMLNRCTSGYRIFGFGVKEKEKGSGNNIIVRKKASSETRKEHTMGDLT